MKTYNRPIVQVTDCLTTNMLMTGNVSGGSMKGIHQGKVDDPIDIY